MPSYDYKCPDCHDVYEFSHSIGEDIIYKCPECQTLLHKVITAPATHFKGGGWGGSYPGRSYKASTVADAATGEIGSKKVEEIGPAIKRPKKG